MKAHLHAIILVALLPAFALAGEWPQILGPARNGIAEKEQLLVTWPAAGPRVVWKVPLGEGYGGVAVSGGKVIVFDRSDDQERVQALDPASGKPLWTTKYPATYRDGFDADRGPRTVPLVHAGRVYLFGAAGDLYCLALADGKKLWSRAAYEDYGGDLGYFGAGSTPIVLGDRIVVNVGGRRGAALVAFALDTGKTLWQAFDDTASYSSPMSLTLGGKPAGLFITRLNAVAIDPKDGSVLAQFPFGKRGPTVNAAVPILAGSQVFVTASYGIGGKLVDLAGAEPKDVWANDDTLSSQYNSPVYLDGYLYGIHGREDIGAAELRCVEAKTGRVAWSVPDFGCAHLILVEKKLLLTANDGRVLVADASPTAYRELLKAKITTNAVRALPALSQGRLYVRDHERGGACTLYSLEVGK